METQVIQRDNSHYATVEVKDTFLNIEGEGATYYLLVRGIYNREVILSDNLLEKVGNTDLEKLFSGKELLTEGYNIVFLEKSDENMYSFLSPARYAVYCCSFDSKEGLTIYEPVESDYNTYVDVSKKVNYTLTLEKTRKKGLFGRSKEVDDSNYLLEIEKIPDYIEGSLSYNFDDYPYSYPVTQEMLGKEMSIPSLRGKAPHITSESGGYKLGSDN